MEDRREVLRELYTRYGSSVLNRCQYLLKDRARAEDAMQDVFARAFTNLNGFRSESSPLTWLMKIATHHCLNELRSEKAAWRKGLEQTAQLRPVSVDGAGQFEARDEVRRLLGKFDVETQQAAVHYWVDGMTLEEIAVVLERSVPTIRKRLETFAKAGGKALKC
jgi:RNA polymerase sigma-70 factor (ECF subfamily)